MCVYIYIYIYKCVCVYVCMYVCKLLRLLRVQSTVYLYSKSLNASFPQKYYRNKNLLVPQIRLLSYVSIAFWMIRSIRLSGTSLWREAPSVLRSCSGLPWCWLRILREQVPSPTSSAGFWCSPRGREYPDETLTPTPVSPNPQTLNLKSP